METFLKSLEALTQHIQSNKALDPVAFDLIQLANLSYDEHSKIKKGVKNIELIHCHEFWELIEEIYKGLMLPTISEELQTYFIQLQKEANTAVEVQYQFYPWKKFYVTASISAAVTLKLKTEHAENQIQSFLEYLDIKDTTWKEDLYDFDYKFNFESEVEALFRDIAFECWNKAKSITQSQIHATLKEVNGGSHVHDLGTGKVSDSQ